MIVRKSTYAWYLVDGTRPSPDGISHIRLVPASSSRPRTPPSTAETSGTAPNVVHGHPPSVPALAHRARWEAGPSTRSRVRRL